MPPATNPIDLSTLSAVKGWLKIGDELTDQDQLIQDCITAFSASVLRKTGRGPQDGTIPTESPFNTPVNYDDVYDGSGTQRQPIRNWPITQVASVNVDGVTIPQSSSVQTPGWVVDGDKRFISLRGGYSGAVATFQNYRYQGRGGGYGGGFSSGIQNVEIVYTAGFAEVPEDLEMAVRKVVARNYKRRGWIGLNMQAMANGAGTTSYNSYEMAQDERETIFFYRVQVA